MKKVLVTLCVALSLTALLTAPALAQPFWLSDLTCDLDGNGFFGDPLAKPGRPYVRIEYPSGDLYVHPIYFGAAKPNVPPGTTFDCQITCFDAPFASYTKPNCATTDIITGDLYPAKRVQGFATRANLGVTVCSDLRVDLLIAPPRPSHPQLSPLPPGTRICTEGFKPLF